MKGKIIVEMTIPHISQKFDIRIPIDAHLKEIKEIVIKTVNLLNAEFLVNDDMIFINHDGELLNINYQVKDLNLKNGSKIILI